LRAELEALRTLVAAARTGDHARSLGPEHSPSVRFPAESPSAPSDRAGGSSMTGLAGSLPWSVTRMDG
jgi:hypothetical protein